MMAPFLVVLDPQLKKKKIVKVGPPLTNFLDPRMNAMNFLP